MLRTEGLDEKGLVDAGEITYLQRQELMNIYGTERSPSEVFEMVVKLFFGFVPEPREYRLFIPLVESAKKVHEHFAMAEQSMLTMEHTPEEAAAGIEDVNKRLGYSGAIVSIAEMLGQTPKTVQRMKYDEVFMILWRNVENAKFGKKFREVQNKKLKQQQTRR